MWVMRWRHPLPVEASVGALLWLRMSPRSFVGCDRSAAFSAKKICIECPVLAHQMAHFGNGIRVPPRISGPFGTGILVMYQGHIEGVVLEHCDLLGRLFHPERRSPHVQIGRDSPAKRLCDSTACHRPPMAARLPGTYTPRLLDPPGGNPATYSSHSTDVRLSPQRWATFVSDAPICPCRRHHPNAE